MQSYLRVSILLAVLLLSLKAFSSPLTSRPPFFVLAGDSTTASQAGWGDGFLNTTLYHGAAGKNDGQNGATTVTFREGGDWDRMLSAASEHRGDYLSFVTIQFGHNDQLPIADISIAEYTANLERMAIETYKVGATPILVTPLSRRNYDNSTGEPTIIEDLAAWRNATIHAARNVHSAYIDLNKESTEYLNSIGPKKAHTYNPRPGDNTHLNVAGSRVFGGMVAMLILKVFPWLDNFVRVDWQLREAIEQERYYWPL
ncbi:hypothetical protein PHISP_03341 [Aspergillus sp. HF37]|nr:hypothetical protein PHISP_03341 [Aspergillus sp. HF37]